VCEYHVGFMRIFTQFHHLAAFMFIVLWCCLILLCTGQGTFIHRAAEKGCSRKLQVPDNKKKAGVTASRPSVDYASAKRFLQAQKVGRTV
jgi:hypothetical protein